MDRQPRRTRPGAVAGLCVLVVSLALALAGCSGGSDSVDQAAGGGYGFVQQASGQDFVPVAKRKVAPDLAGQTLTGGRFDLASLRGKIVVVNFWASWCSPCRAETPQIVAFAKANPTVAILGINEKDTDSPARAFVQDHQVSYPSIVDPISTLAARWPVPIGLPSTFVLDAQGRIAARFSGPVIESDLTPIVAKLRANA